MNARKAVQSTGTNMGGTTVGGCPWCWRAGSRDRKGWMPVIHRLSESISPRLGTTFESGDRPRHQFVMFI